MLGVGAYLKNALCLIQGDEAWLSREIGPLDNVAAIKTFQETAQQMIAAAQEKPIAVAHDYHPDFACTRWAVQESGLPAIPIQHHHAHICAIMAEHGIETPILGLALDGFGLGENNEAWGGELLRVDADGYERLGHLKPLPQPGGDIAARQVWRMGAAALWAMGKGDEIATRYAAYPAAATLKQMMDRNLNAPLTSSAGRLFDAACGLLGVKPVAAFEGEAPMELERLATLPCHPRAGGDPDGESNWNHDSDSSLPFEAQPSLDPRFRGDDAGGKRETLWREDAENILSFLPLLERLPAMQPQEGAALFHDALAAGLLAWVEDAVQKTGIRAIAMGGGCFFNKRLREGLMRGMIAKGLIPLAPKDLSPGDAALALGQAYAAALKIEKEG